MVQPKLSDQSLEIKNLQLSYHDKKKREEIERHQVDHAQFQQVE